MGRTVLVSLGLIFGAGAYPPPVLAQEVKEPVVINASGSGHCVDVAELTRRLSLHAGSVVTIDGEPPSLKVSVDGAHGRIEHVVADVTCEEATEAVAAFVTSALLPAPTVTVEKQETTPEPAPKQPSRLGAGDELERATLLAAHLPNAISRDRVNELAVGVLLGIAGGLVGTVAVIQMIDEGATGPTVAYGASGLALLAGGVAMPLVPDPYAGDVMLASVYAGLGSLWLGHGLGGNNFSTLQTIAIAGAYGSASLAGLSLAFDRRTSYKKLRQDLAGGMNSERWHAHCF